MAKAASALNATSKVQLSGPLFAPDAHLKLRENIRRMLAAVADEGARVAEERSPRDTGAFVSGIRSRTAGVRGKPWALTAVVSATHVYPWDVHGSRGFVGRSEAQYRGGKIEARYHMFRNAASQLRQSRAALGVDLVKGLT